MYVQFLPYKECVSISASFSRSIRMRKIDKAVKTESLYIALFTLVLSVLMQSVFLIIGKWDITVLFGNLLSGTLAVSNFFFLALTVQIALEKEEKAAKDTMKLSQSLRTIVLFAVTVVGVSFPAYFNIWTAIIPLIFPRVAIAFRGLFNKKTTDTATEAGADTGDAENAADDNENANQE